MTQLSSSGNELIQMSEGAVILKGFLLKHEQELLRNLERITDLSAFRHMVTPGGYRMSVAMTNCGPRGWVTDERGYRYSETDPETGHAWPEMPALYSQLARQAAAVAGYHDFCSDACLINRYIPGARLSLHQDKDEKNFTHPIVSFSLGLPATFDFGGRTRSAPVTPYLLEHGDVVVWGGPSRMFYHGIRTLKKGHHERMGSQRINLTFRRAH
ncbi:DNA oxidative demethylase AlkB [Pantoea sp. EABMAA-21]|uniref:DNA oxidative demethylase AlkB n=1 Tax=Pantoea sp. EABMAA-21 TaxID=3043302 RepID=UPI0024B485F0|nr:DNA oxidative demethylase AlkB [Pantoea sp. EABMAA-21]MDI9280121.1 DNA oxidative demethylase AlkB [Pantoea sp. EABMAA-21]